MRFIAQREFSHEQEKIVRKAKILEFLGILHLSSTVVLMYFFMGNSQAMRTAWIEDALSLIPPITFFITNYFRDKKPNKRFPYGYHRVVSFGFFVSSLALLSIGAFLLIESALKLISAEHPTIGLVPLGNSDLWLGWIMIIVLVYGTVPSLILGYHKQKLAFPIHNKILYTDAKMNKADWETALAAMIGVLGVGMGFWWTDALAALFVSQSIFRDGLVLSKDGFTELLNRSPKDLEGNYIDLPKKIENFLLTKKGIIQAEVRMYEHGHVIFADAFIDINNNFASDAEDLKYKFVALRKDILDQSWRLQDVMLTFSYSE